MSEYVWYCSYGSNLLYERFKLYIQGGTAPFIDKNFAGCTNKQLPEDNSGMIIPFELYFSKQSKPWENKAVAFIDSKKDISKQTWSRIYKITREQFRQVVLQENGLLPGEPLEIDFNALEKKGSCLIGSEGQFRWYGRLLKVGEKENLPIITFTAKWDMDDVEPFAPGEKYLTTIIRGIKESQSVNPGDIFNYLKNIKGIAGRFSDKSLKEIIDHAIL